MQIAEILNHNGLIYQPIPFEEYKDTNSQRKDCEERYQIIKKSYGDFKDKTLIDICCANGFFLFRFMQDGGKSARGIEMRREISNFINLLSAEKNVDISCNYHLNGLTNQKFDVGIYLDTHYAPDTEKYPEWLAKHTKVCFTSSAERGEDYRILLRALFKEVIPIYQGYAGRTIFKCA